MKIPAPVRTLHLVIALLIPALTGLALGLAIALITFSRRKGLNVMTWYLGRFGALLAGIDIRISGNIPASSRPCVFVFNHQSGLDPILLCRIIERDVIAIAKSELKRNPYRRLL